MQDEYWDDEPSEWELEAPLDDEAKRELETAQQAREKAERIALREPIPEGWTPAPEGEWTEERDAKLLAGKLSTWEPDYRLSDREKNYRLRRRPGSAGDEKRTREEQLGIDGGGSIYEAPLGSGGRGRKVNRNGAVKIKRPDGTETYRDIRNDEAAILDWLTRDGRTLDYYMPALRRGKPSAETKAIKAELAAKVTELVDMGAYRQNIASILGISPQAVARLIVKF
jgi:hypothetical protein